MTSADGRGNWAWDSVETIRKAGSPVATAFTGGGSLAVSWLFNHAGASRAFLEAQIPYDERALEDYIGHAGPHPAVQETARRLAMVARQRARRFGGGDRAIGLGVSAALATDRQRRGQDRAFLAACNNTNYSFTHLQFDKTADRTAQEEVLSSVLLVNLARSCNCSIGEYAAPEWAVVEQATARVDSNVEQLLDGDVAAVEIKEAASMPSVATQLLVPGSFNPFHAGHAGLAAAAQRSSGRVAGFELSIHNVDKPTLPYDKIMQRVDQPRDGRCLVLTGEPTFLGKARVLPGCWFAIGFDTAVRLVAPGYYDGTMAGVQRALQELRVLGSRFYVAGRQWQGKFQGLGNVEVPEAFKDMFVEIPEADFRLDMSSTDLRQKTQSDAG